MSERPAFIAATGHAWRLVESQHLISTMKLVDSLDEQALLEDMLDASKPPVPSPCRHLHYLLYTPFRYTPSHNSRFARAHSADRAFYASEHVDTAVAEIAFYRLLFFTESPATRLPRNPLEFTAFSVHWASDSMIDLTTPPWDIQSADWLHPIDYSACLALSDRLRSHDAGIIRSVSARDPEHRCNITLLNCSAFAMAEPQGYETWHLMLGNTGVMARSANSGTRLTFDITVFSSDPRFQATVNHLDLI